MKWTAKLQTGIKVKSKQIESLHTKRFYLESYNRRENLIFFWYHGELQKGRRLLIGTRDVISSDFMENVLGNEDSRRNIEIQVNASTGLENDVKKHAHFT